MELTVNLEPAFIVLTVNSQTTVTQCSREQIRELLTSLGCVQWPLRDCVARVSIPESSEVAEIVLGFVQPASLKAAS